MVTVFLQSDAAVTIYFTARLEQLLFEGGVHFLGKLRYFNNSWKRYVRVRQWWLLDTVTSTHSLSVLLSVVGTTHTTQSVLALLAVSQKSFAHVFTCRITWPTRMHVLRFLAYHSRVVFIFQELQIMWLLFEGGIYSKKYSNKIPSNFTLSYHYLYFYMFISTP